MTGGGLAYRGHAGNRIGHAGDGLGEFRGGIADTPSGAVDLALLVVDQPSGREPDARRVDRLREPDTEEDDRRLAARTHEVDGPRLDRRLALAARSHPEAGVRIRVDRRQTAGGHNESDGPARWGCLGDGAGAGELEERSRERLADLAFELLERPVRTFCDIETDVEVAVPESGSSRERAICASCGEDVLAAKAVEVEGETVCRSCADGSVR